MLLLLLLDYPITKRFKHLTSTSQMTSTGLLQ
jgi:hypothetical protein